jgi:hypothetical protein
VAAWVFYVDALFGINPSGIGNWGIALTGLWIRRPLTWPVSGRWPGFRNLTVVLKFLPAVMRHWPHDRALAWAAGGYVNRSRPATTPSICRA